MNGTIFQSQTGTVLTWKYTSLGLSLSLNDQYSVTLSASEGVCVFRGTLLTDDGHRQFNKGRIEGRSVALVQFFIMALEVGSHKLSFTLTTRWGSETVVKTLRVVVREHETFVNSKEF